MRTLSYFPICFHGYSEHINKRDECRKIYENEVETTGKKNRNIRVKKKLNSQKTMSYFYEKKGFIL